MVPARRCAALEISLGLAVLADRRSMSARLGSPAAGRSRAADMSGAGSHEGRPIFLAFWHGRILDDPMRLAALARSPHADLGPSRWPRSSPARSRYFGIEWIAGSIERGRRLGGAARDAESAQGRATASASRRTGRDGPAMRAKPGIVIAARLAGAPIVPVSLCDAPALASSAAGIAFICRCPSAAASSLGRADRDAAMPATGGDRSGAAARRGRGLNAHHRRSRSPHGP